MKVIRRVCDDIEKEISHNGAGSRKLFIKDQEVGNIKELTYTWLPAHQKFEKHNHPDVDEVMFVITGNGIIKDDDGEYPYKHADVYIFPKGTDHEIINNSEEEHKFVFMRVYH